MFVKQLNKTTVQLKSVKVKTSFLILQVELEQCKILRILFPIIYTDLTPYKIYMLYFHYERQTILIINVL